LNCIFVHVVINVLSWKISRFIRLSQQFLEIIYGEVPITPKEGPMNRFLKYGTVTALGLAIVSGLTPVSAPAQAQAMYEGKTVTILIGYGFGGTYGKYARLMSKHLPRFIDGKPNIIVQSMPGAGGLKSVNYAYNVLPKQGMHFFVPADSVVISQLMRPKKIKYNAPEFTWLGGTNQTNSIFVLRTSTGIKHWTDMRTKQAISGHTGPGSTSFLLPRLMKVALGLKIKQIGGYKGSRNTILAMEQGEHDGTGFNWLAWSSIVPHWFAPGKEQGIALMQLGHFKDPDLPNVPMLGDIVDAKYKAMIAFMATHGLIGRSLALPPGVPKKLVNPLRTAFDKMVNDPTYNAEAKKTGLRVISSTGQQIQKVVADGIRNADPKVVAQAAKIIFGK
jgi:tripartite-type tricarboxylate transporter receptor subunit TctC